MKAQATCDLVEHDFYDELSLSKVSSLSETLLNDLRIKLLFGLREFQKVYGALRRQYNATSLPNIFEKTNVNFNAAKKRMDGKWWLEWKSRWPLGGLYGMLLATLSGDIHLHRNAKWRHKNRRWSVTQMFSFCILQNAVLPTNSPSPRADHV